MHTFTHDSRVVMTLDAGGTNFRFSAFRGGIAVGPMLEQRFGIPVFINNDGDLFAYGEAIAGLLPDVNRLLEKAGSPRRYKNLFGITLGTGFGGGIVRNGELFLGDNSMAGEVWLLRNKLNPVMNADEGASLRALRLWYTEQTGLAFEIQDHEQMDPIQEGETLQISLPGSHRKVQDDPLRHIGIGVSRLGTSEAIAMGAYAFALSKLARDEDRKASELAEMTF